MAKQSSAEKCKLRKKLKNIESQSGKDFKTFQTGTAIMGRRRVQHVQLAVSHAKTGQRFANVAVWK